MLGMLGWLISWFWQPPKPIETFEEALKIGQCEVQKRFPGDYSSFNADLWYDPQKSVWHFRYFIKHEQGEYLLGGIGPGVDIRKSDGKITYLKGQK